MANRRMFSKDIVDSDKFLDMPPTAQNLYFHLGVHADDDGFVSSPKKVQRSATASNDDLTTLINKDFIIPFETGIVVITDWHLNNQIRKDRYKETIYQEEKKNLVLMNNEKYQYIGALPEVDDQMTTAWQPSDNQMETQYRLGKYRLGKDSIGKDSIGKDNIPSPDEKIPYQEIIEYLNQKANKKFKVVQKHKDFIKARWNEGQRMDDFQKVVDNMVANWTGQFFEGKPAENYLQPSTLFGNKFDQYLNQKPKTNIFDQENGYDPELGF